MELRVMKSVARSYLYTHTHPKASNLSEHKNDEYKDYNSERSANLRNSVGGSVQCQIQLKFFSRKT